MRPNLLIFEAVRAFFLLWKNGLHQNEGGSPLNREKAKAGSAIKRSYLEEARFAESIACTIMDKNSKLLHESPKYDMKSVLLKLF